jgi:hypothetical protein
VRPAVAAADTLTPLAGNTVRTAEAAVTLVCTTCAVSLVTRTTQAFLHIPMHLGTGLTLHPKGKSPRTALITSLAPPRAHALPVQTSTVARAHTASPPPMPSPG